MSNRAAEFTSAVFAAVLAGFSVSAVLHNEADAAEGCQTAPGDQTPQGKHWKYRIEHPGNRQCWYLRDLGDKSAPAALTQRSEQPSEPQAEAPAPQHSVADARAEYPWPQPRLEQNSAASTPQGAQAPQGVQAPQGAQTPPANAASEQSPNVLQNTTRGSLIGTRWPDPSAPNSTLSPQAATSETVDEAKPNQSTPAKANAPVPLATADAMPAKATGSLQTLLMVIAGALAFAGVIGSAIFRLATRRSAPSAERGHRRVVWETADAAPQSPLPPRPSASRQSSPKVPPWIDPEQAARRPDLAPGFYEGGNHNERLDRISELLERMSRQPASSAAGSASREQTPTGRPDVRA